MSSYANVYCGYGIEPTDENPELLQTLIEAVDCGEEENYRGIIIHCADYDKKKFIVFAKNSMTKWDDITRSIHSYKAVKKTDIKSSQVAIKSFLDEVGCSDEFEVQQFIAADYY